MRLANKNDTKKNDIWRAGLFCIFVVVLEFGWDVLPSLRC